MLLPLTCTELILEDEVLNAEPLGDAVQVVLDHIVRGVGGMVVLGPFGSGKSTLCHQLASLPAIGRRPCSSVPIRVLDRHLDVEQALSQAIGAQALAEARRGERVILLDGLDEIGTLGAARFRALFHDLTDRVGPTWVLTSRPGTFRTEPDHDDEQVDSLSLPSVRTLHLDSLGPAEVAQQLQRAGGERQLGSVEGLLELGSTPVLLQAILAALPYIESGRPIQPWGVFDAWIRHALRTGPNHDAQVEALAELAWSAFDARAHSLEAPRLSREAIDSLSLPPSLSSALFVAELDGGLRFVHRSVYEYLLATRIAPRIAANQGHGPDGITGLRITDAMRAFLVGGCGAMPVVYSAHGTRVRVPRGNFVSGGEASADERPLRIAHLTAPVWLDRAPVTNADWVAFLDAVPDDRVDANYLAHWGVERIAPNDQHDLPIYGIWPEDADRYAAWAGGRLPTADEWEKAARGIDGRRWSWGDHYRPVACTAELGTPLPLPVRALGAHGDAGLFSAIGGVFEYTSTLWRGQANRGRVVMGGCYSHPASTARAGLRLSHKLSGNLKAGLRIARDHP